MLLNLVSGKALTHQRAQGLMGLYTFRKTGLNGAKPIWLRAWAFLAGWRRCRTSRPGTADQVALVADLKTQLCNCVFRPFR
jgi:hypothetical protein